MLSQLARTLKREQLILYLCMMLIEVNDFFNVKGNMNSKQIQLTAELIADNPGFYDLTLGNVKACFRHCMATKKLYDRLDGNLIIGWLREFKSEMADHCENVVSGNEAAARREELSGDAGAISHATYMAMLEARVNDGDADAARILDAYRERSKTVSPEEKRQKDMEFMKFKHEYLKKHGYGGKV